jgi:hypothetical protein
MATRTRWTAAATAGLLLAGLGGSQGLAPAAALALGAGQAGAAECTGAMQPALDASNAAQATAKTYKNPGVDRGVYCKEMNAHLALLGFHDLQLRSCEAVAFEEPRQSNVSLFRQQMREVRSNLTKVTEILCKAG